MKKILFLIFISLALTSCNSLVHVSGTGASKSTVVSKKQWYALWGLVRLNKVDAKGLAGGATNYTVKTGFGLGDILTDFFTSFISLEKETVTVIK